MCGILTPQKKFHLENFMSLANLHFIQTDGKTKGRPNSFSECNLDVNTKQKKEKKRKPILISYINVGIKIVNKARFRAGWLMPAILSTQEGEIRRITVQIQAQQILLETLSQKCPMQKRAEGVAQVGEHLPSKCETPVLQNQ
jgi:hypothetical protein